MAVNYQVVLYLILQNLETFNLSVKLCWHQLRSHPKDYPWMIISHFSNCKGGETEMMIKNYDKLNSNARVNNPTKFCDEILGNLIPGVGKKNFRKCKMEIDFDWRVSFKKID